MTYLHTSNSAECSFVKSELISSISRILHSILNIPGDTDAERFQDSTPNNDILSMFSSSDSDSERNQTGSNNISTRNTDVIVTVISELEKLIKRTEEIEKQIKVEVLCVKL